MVEDRLSLTFAALADPTRRSMVERLAHGALTVNELAEPFALTQQAVSKHLKVLERAGLWVSHSRRPVPPVCAEHRALDLAAELDHAAPTGLVGTVRPTRRIPGDAPARERRIIMTDVSSPTDGCTTHRANWSSTALTIPEHLRAAGVRPAPPPRSTAHLQLALAGRDLETIPQWIHVTTADVAVPTPSGPCSGRPASAPATSGVCQKRRGRRPDRPAGGSLITAFDGAGPECTTFGTNVRPGIVARLSAVPADHGQSGRRFDTYLATLADHWPKGLHFRGLERRGHNNLGQYRHLRWRYGVRRSCPCRQRSGPRCPSTGRCVTAAWGR